jgi:GT2 family glycosyltransferase
MPEELAPPVVAVVVTLNPEEWFEACLESLYAQDYPNLAVLVVDDASETDVNLRVAAVEPATIVRRRTTQGGYAASANEALTGVAGATFFLFCHDDVVLDPSAVRRLVEESFRSNAAVVGPKFVSAADPSRLLHVGLGMHRLGTPQSRVHAGELDQSQHDEARDVFATPGGCTLIRADIFAALDGFDPAMSLFGEDVDFCWRAQIAGARVTVAPQARVAHRQIAASGGRDVGDVDLLQRRHELRSALKNYRHMRRWVVIFELLVLGIAEMVVGVLTGERERARRVVRAWRWNLAERQSLRLARSHLREVRQASDRALVGRMAGRGRVRRFFRPEVPGEAPERLRAAVSGLEHTLEVDRLGSWWAGVQRGEVPAAQLSFAGLLVVMGLLGLRDLLFAPLPVVGELIKMPSGWTMLGTFLRGLPFGATVRPAPTAYGLVGLLGLVLGDSSALALKVVDIGALVVGAIGVSRLCRPFLSSRARLVAATVFFGLPLAWNALGTGNMQAAVTLGALPYVFSRLGRATGLAPFGGGPARSLVGEIAPFGLVLAVLGALAPAGLLAVGVVVVAVVMTCLLGGEGKAALRSFGVAAGALAVAGLCCLPWSLTWFEPGARWSAFSGVVPGVPLDPASLLRGHIGPIGAWWGAWGLVVAAVYVLAVSRRERLRWATACWLSAAGAVALAWAGSRGWLGAGGGDTAVLVAPAGVAIATACGLGVVSFERDVITSHVLGWRQAGAFLAGLCLVAGMIPALGVAIGGRADLPSEGIDQIAPAGRGTYRVLWLGDPRVLPAAGWQLSPGLSWYTSTTGLPAGDQDWPSADPGAVGQVGSALESAIKGRTADVGVYLARLGVRFVVVPVADAPLLPGTQVPPLVASPPQGVLSVLETQGDLVEQPVESGAHVFVNAAWVAADGTGAALREGRSGSDRAASRSLWLDLGVPVGLLAWLAAIAEGVTRRRRWDRRRSDDPVAPEQATVAP